MTLALASTNPTGGQSVPARLAHDIRNTLSTIALHLETLERFAGASGAKAAARFATTGNGYGLAIARELAERNGGMLELKPVTSGTSFALTLSALAMTPVKTSPVTRLLGRQAMSM